MSLTLDQIDDKLALAATKRAQVKSTIQTHKEAIETLEAKLVRINELAKNLLEIKTSVEEYETNEDALGS